MGCSQTSTRRWNMDVHMMRKHGGRHAEFEPPKTGPWSIPNSRQPSLSPNYRESHTYETNLTDAIKKTEILQDEFLESFRKFNEANRLLTPESSLNEIGKLFMTQLFADSFQGTRTMPTASGRTITTKKETLTSGYRISFCDTCLSGCQLRPISYPIYFEAETKLVHECDSKKLFTGQNQIEEVKAKLGDLLSQFVSYRIGQRDAYLKARQLSQNFFSEETRSKWKLPPNRDLLEERDCIRFNPSRDMSNIDHWFHRTIRDYDKDSNIKVTQGELTEFLQIAKATFGVFQVDTNDPAKKYYFLIYLVL
jgi:hypothetical protein